MVSLTAGVVSGRPSSPVAVLENRLLGKQEMTRCRQEMTFRAQRKIGSVEEKLGYRSLDQLEIQTRIQKIRQE